MTITKLKAKNQITIPVEIVKRMRLRPYEFLLIGIEKNYIKLTPVDIQPRYSPEELKAIDKIVSQQKGKSKITRPGKDFKDRIKKIMI